eukprot:SAG11_NODE_6216_length_1362_cov_1.382423_1_plen_119_part_01
MAPAPCFRAPCLKTGSFGVLPSPQLPNTFVTQGFDAGEPMGDAHWNLGAKYSRSYGINTPYSMGGCDDGPASSWGGEVPFSPFFMGPIHPRTKHLIGRRMALTTAHHVYNRSDVPWTGP